MIVIIILICCVNCVLCTDNVIGFSFRPVNCSAVTMGVSDVGGGGSSTVVGPPTWQDTPAHAASFPGGGETVPGEAGQGQTRCSVQRELIWYR